MILDPLHGVGYQFFSGIGSGSPLFGLLYVLWRRHHCHHPRCPRIQFKAHPDDSTHVLCRKHYPKEKHGH